MRDILIVMLVCIVLAAGVFAYVFPSFVAYKRRCNTMTVFVVNVFFGWTFIGWAIALAMAVAATPEGTRK
jgi:hypothetical protein